MNQVLTHNHGIQSESIWVILDISSVFPTFLLVQATILHQFHGSKTHELPSGNLTY